MSLDGREYESLKVNQLRGMFGVVTQETELFALTGKSSDFFYTRNLAGTEEGSY